MDGDQLLFRGKNNGKFELSHLYHEQLADEHNEQTIGISAVLSD